MASTKVQGFGPGEQMSYQVRFLGVPTGVAQVTVGWATQRDGKRVWPLVCVGQTTSIASVFQVNDRFISYWDPTSQRPIGSEMHADENRRRWRERYRYDDAVLKAFATKQREGNGPVEIEYDVMPQTYDLASVGFHMRSADFRIGATRDIPVFTGRSTYVMHAAVEARETITTPLGTFDAWKVSFNGEFTGNVATQGNMFIYYTTDARHLPIRAEAIFKVGAVTIDAVTYAPGAEDPS
ncbi:MAG: DUF3108 domain-containing protein [Archangium sp.]|nr:DUF3108 domain-containing protein [Archangium sp.]